MKEAKVSRIAQIASVALAVLFLLTSQIAAQGAFVWEEDFETGIDGWTIASGDFEVGTDGILRATAVQTGGEFNYVYHNSDVENGTWLFDVILYDNTLSSVWVMANGDGDGTMGNTRGLALDFHFNQINLTRYNGGGLGDYSTVGVADGINTDYGLFHVKVVGSRSRLTHLQNYYVYLNDTLIIDEQVLIRVDRSTHFWFMGDLNCGIDNITVYEDEEATQTCAFNTTTTGPPPSIPPLIDPMLILAVGGGGAVVLAAVAVFHKLRT